MGLGKFSSKKASVENLNIWLQMFAELEFSRESVESFLSNIYKKDLPKGVTKEQILSRF